MTEKTHIIHHNELHPEPRVNYMPLIGVVISLLTGGIAVYTTMQNTISTLELRVKYLEDHQRNIPTRLSAINKRINSIQKDISDLSSIVSINEINTTRRFNALKGK